MFSGCCFVSSRNFDAFFLLDLLWNPSFGTLRFPVRHSKTRWNIRWILPMGLEIDPFQEMRDDEIRNMFVSFWVYPRETIWETDEKGGGFNSFAFFLTFHRNCFLFRTPRTGEMIHWIGLVQPPPNWCCSKNLCYIVSSFVLQIPLWTQTLNVYYLHENSL